MATTRTSPSPKRIKREPLSTTIENTPSSSSSSSLLSSCPSHNPHIPINNVSTPSRLNNNVMIIKREPVEPEPEDEEEDDEELPAPDPTKPKNYKRIRRRQSSDEDNNNGTKNNHRGIGALADKSESDDDGEFVPLVTEDMMSDSDSDMDSVSSDDDGKRHSKRRRQRDNKKKKDEQKTKKPIKRGVRTRRQKKSSDDLSSGLSDISETKSLDGFIVGDEEVASDPELDDQELSSESERNKRRSQSNKKSKKKVRRKKISKSKKTSESSDSELLSVSDDSLKDLFQVKPKPQAGTSSKKVNKNNSDSEILSSSSSYDTHSPKHNKNTTLGNDVVSELRSIIPTCTGVSSRRRRKRSGNSLIYGKTSSNDEVGYDSDDSFIDKTAPKNNWNLESSSESDQEVVEEDASNLDLNSDNFEEGATSSSSSDDDDSKHEKSQSSSNDEEDEYKIFLQAKNISNPDGQIPDKCEMCENLGDIDFRHRENFVDAEKWCQCGHCKVVSPKMHNYDRVCCKEILKVETEYLDDNIKCITQHSSFEKKVLQLGALLGKNDKIASKTLSGFRRSTDKEKVLKCKECFLLWVFGKMSFSNGIPMVVPACVVKKIRKKHTPTSGPSYFDPFKIKKVCKFEKHCSNAKNMI